MNLRKRSRQIKARTTLKSDPSVCLSYKKYTKGIKKRMKRGHGMRLCVEVETEIEDLFQTTFTYSLPNSLSLLRQEAADEYFQYFAGNIYL